MENPKQKPTRSQIHPSILTQPLINKEKEKEKELRDKERGNTSKKQVYTIEIDESETNNIIDITSDNTPDNKTEQTLTKLVNDKINKSSTTKTARVPRILQMIANQKPYDVIENLNNIKCNIILP